MGVNCRVLLFVLICCCLLVGHVCRCLFVVACLWLCVGMIDLSFVVACCELLLFRFVRCALSLCCYFGVMLFVV